jgi:hypothetical protein
VISAKQKKERGQKNWGAEAAIEHEIMRKSLTEMVSFQ